MQFKAAKRGKKPLRLLLQGPAGAGKTYSALVVAEALVKAGMGKKTGLIDTELDGDEEGSSTLYSPPFAFDVCPLPAPHTVERYVEAMAAAARAAYDVLIIDSTTHAWEAVLDRVSEMQGGRDKGFVVWNRYGTPTWNKFVRALKRYPGHLIACARSKWEYVDAVDKKGGAYKEKVGTAAKLREGTDFELDIVGEIAPDHVIRFGKSRCSALASRRFPVLDGEVTDILIGWLSGAEEVTK